MDSAHHISFYREMLVMARAFGPKRMEHSLFLAQAAVSRQLYLICKRQEAAARVG